VQHRLFIALWPSAAAARQLANLTDALHAECGGRKIPRANQHVTVAFLGNVAAEGMVDVQQAMHQSVTHSFELQLDAVEYRKRGGMLWARASRVPEALDALVQQLRVRLGDAGFSVEDRAFVPHVTLLRDAQKPAHLNIPLHLNWQAHELTLVRSHLDRHAARYDVVYRVALPAHRANASA